MTAKLAQVLPVRLERSFSSVKLHCQLTRGFLDRLCGPPARSILNSSHLLTRALVNGRACALEYHTLGRGCKFGRATETKLVLISGAYRDPASSGCT
jgi:hypothetical protein